MKATEKKLSSLHGKLADCLVEIIEHTEEITTFDEEGEEVGTGEHRRTCAPATLAVAAKFLKDNSITCDIEQNENMEKLSDLLGNKQKHSRRLGNAKALAQAH